MGNISRNFSLSEFDSHDGALMPDSVKQNIIMLVNTILQPARDELGKPINIISGYRSPDHNAAVKGRRNSQHLLGKAADISIEGMNPSDVADYLERRFNPGGLGRYINFTHVDIRQGRSRW